MLDGLRSAASRGQSMLEYALIILFVVLVAIGGLVLIGPVVSNIFSSASSAF